MSDGLSIVSTTFLFLFFPLATGLYFLIPRKKDLKLRNAFLIAVSIFFYAWGEPVTVFLLIFLIILTWLFGNMASGNSRTLKGKTAVFLTIVMNISSALILAEFNSLIGILEKISGIDLPFSLDTLPLGFSFFLFSSISYVVDIYRGQCRAERSLLNAALYTCAFFRITQGPIISYYKFEEQLEQRKESFESFAEGIRRFSLGLGKKMIIAQNLAPLVKVIFKSDFQNLTMADAWLGCSSFLVYMYFDFSGYSDMAIGLAGIFGFSIPENFNYPYISTSVSEFWRRFHITLCVWFTDYLYYPLALGPSVRLRKYLQKHNVSVKAAKFLQNLFVTVLVWFATAFWHGASLNYLIWGLMNCLAILAESYVKPLKNRTLDSLLHRIGFITFLFLSVPLISTGTIEEAAALYKVMFAGGIVCKTGVSVYYLLKVWPFLLIGTVGCFPLIPYFKNRFIDGSNRKIQTVWEAVSSVMLFLTVVLSLMYLFNNGNTVFLYQQ